MATILDTYRTTKLEVEGVFVMVWYHIKQTSEGDNVDSQYIVTTKIKIEDIYPANDEQGFKEVQDYIINNNLTLQEVFEPLVLDELS